MSKIQSNSKKLPYYAVIFTSVKSESDNDGYKMMAEKMVELAKTQSGFLGIESANDKIGITVSYWQDIDAIKKWKLNSEHLLAQELGKKKWYKRYNVRIAKVEREYEFVSLD